jgi:MoaA/NifB/PqqE/SkfB family radical SAM enzyme
MPPKFYVPELVNPLTRLKYRIYDRRRPLPPFPEHAQIQTISGCNANCVFCPNQKTELDIPMGRPMDMGLFRSIVDQLVEQPRLWRISPYLMNEPLLDKQLPERVKYITDRKRRDQFTKINSHGNACNERMAKGLLDAGLDRINFSVQGIEPTVYEEIMHLKFEKTVQNIERMVKMRTDGGYRTRIRVCMLCTKMIEPHLPAIRKFWADREVKINVNQLENRGRHRHIQSDDIASKPLLTYHWCNRMFNQIYILHDGRLVMCCADWEQTGVMGDASKDRIADIWFNAKYREFRRRFLTGEVRGMLCDGCTKDGGDDED